MGIKYIAYMDGWQRAIMKYDTVNGYDEYRPHIIFIYHRSITVSNAFDTLDDAMRQWGEWSTKPVRLPDGKLISPAAYFGAGTLDEILKPWNPNCIEVWPGEKIS